MVNLCKHPDRMQMAVQIRAGMAVCYALLNIMNRLNFIFQRPVGQNACVGLDEQAQLCSCNIWTVL